jgi:hypothetical protein
MNISRFAVAVLLLLTTVSYAADDWQLVDEGFRFRLPSDWKKVNRRGIDSHVGEYRGRTAYLEFDEVYGLGNTVEQSAEATKQWAAAEADPTLLKPGEEIWRLDGRIARFSLEKVDAEIYGKREFQFVARLSVWYAGKPAGLGVYVFYESEKDLPTVRRILRSFEWPTESPTRRVLLRRSAQRDLG